MQGPLADERLTIVPLPQVTWSEWKTQFPHTLVLDPNTPFQDRYSPPLRIGQPGRDEALYGDDRLPSNALVVGVEAGGEFAGFTLQYLQATGGVLNTMVGDAPVLVMYDALSQTGIAFSRTLNSQTLDFDVANPPGGAITVVDRQTGSRWNVFGKAIDGPLSGESLPFAPSLISEWYGWSAYHPQTALFSQPGE